LTTSVIVGPICLDRDLSSITSSPVSSHRGWRADRPWLQWPLALGSWTGYHRLIQGQTIPPERFRSPQNFL